MPARIVAETLEAWRDADRVRHATEPFSPEKEELTAVIATLVRVYRLLTSQRPLPDEAISEARRVVTSAQQTTDRVKDRLSRRRAERAAAVRSCRVGRPRSRVTDRSLGS